MRSAKDQQDRGPLWLVAANGHHVAYTPQAVADFLRKRSEKLRAQADALLARVAETGAAS
jgi:hypothetical protein